MYVLIGAVNVTAGFWVWNEWKDLGRRDKKAAAGADSSRTSLLT